MADIQQTTLYLLTPGSYVSRDHLTLYDAAGWQGRSRPACERGARIASVQGPQHAVPPRIGPRVNQNVNPA